MRRLIPFVVLLAFAGCGGDDDGGGGTDTFDDDKFGITFDYPSDFDEFDEVKFSQSLGTEAKAQAAVGLDESNAIALSRYAIDVSVSPENIDQVKPELDRLIQSAVPDADGKPVEVGGLPGFEYQVAVSDNPGADARLTFLFDGKDEYLITCQGKGDKADEIEAGCRTALRTLETH